ncbi:SPFH domain-containing protein [Enterovirga rhinocerotis]|uniref:Regulator of protease activity HflC (Stomatin/prohibitin superfamily) n=1 Tax=Enterovirga rhinocerotis TaxID=1339210 RepID=A0A4R7CCF6_9HYPH|nr:SPFH domain-containing protein [Enterovirga rhinocerotis]TDR94487.1 regulator of protease activity HflC (stomatin/prohibitin superfamily) [Enterovirga rhinocerotis]
MEIVFLAILAAVGFAIAFRVRQQKQGRMTVHAWELGLLYVDGRFVEALPPGRYNTLGFSERLVVKLRRFPIPETIHQIEVTSAERLSYRLSATIVFEVADARIAHEGRYQDMLRLAVSDAVVQMAAGRSVESVLGERASLGATILAGLGQPICGCTVKQVVVTAVTLPPELRRLYAEVERARLEGQAALERARGEQASLRSLANAARMLKGNPELMNLRLLQALSTPGGKGATLVLGRDALAATSVGEDEVR